MNFGAFVWKGGAVGHKKNGLSKHSHTRTTQLTRYLYLYRHNAKCQEFCSKNKLYSGLEGEFSNLSLEIHPKSTLIRLPGDSGGQATIDI